MSKKDSLGILDAFGMSDDSDDTSEEPNKECQNKDSTKSQSQEIVNEEDIEMAPAQMDFNLLK